MNDTDQFIDADVPFTKESNTFQEILNRQIRNTADILSKDLSVGFYLGEDKKMYLEDRKELAINHVRTTMSLMAPFIKSNFYDEIKVLKEEFLELKKQLGEKKIMVKGKGMLNSSEVFHDSKSVPYMKLMEQKVETYRQIFEILIMAYHKNKQEIRSFSQE